MPEAKDAGSMTRERMIEILDGACVSVAACHDCRWDGTLLEPRLWEELRIELQRRFRRSTGEERAIIFIDLTGEPRWEDDLVTPAKLSKWGGWDKSNPPFSEAKHKDAVCYAAFGQAWSMEDAEVLIGFIDRTWLTPAGRKALEEAGDA